MDQLLCNRLVMGIRDTALSKRLQMDAELDLEKAKKMIRQREAVKKTTISYYRMVDRVTWTK